jgi:hypothetical protein
MLGPDERRTPMSIIYKAARIMALDGEERPVSPVSGFFLDSGDGQIRLYTCWHVVTGIDYHELNVTAKSWPPRRLQCL